MYVYSSGTFREKLEKRAMTWDNDLSASATKQWIVSLTNIKDHITKLFDNYIAIGDFHLEANDTTLKHFLGSNGLYNLLKGHSCFKGRISFIDLLLTNRNVSFTNTHCLKLVLVMIIIWSLPCSKLLCRNLNRKNWFEEILKTFILKVTKMIYWKIWLSMIDHMTNLIKTLLRY